MEKRTFLKSGLFLGFAAAASSFIEACTPKAAAPATLPPSSANTKLVRIVETRRRKLSANTFLSD